MIQMIRKSMKQEKVLIKRKIVFKIKICFKSKEDVVL